jgi:DnaJ-class molecular chaperone
VDKIMRAKDFYEILGLSKGCAEDDLKRSYKKLALRFHPDKNKAPKAEEAFKKIAAAYACLSDGDKRAAYDRGETRNLFQNTPSQPEWDDEEEEDDGHGHGHHHGHHR